MILSYICVLHDDQAPRLHISITVKFISVKQQLSSLPIGTDTLIDSIQRSAQELHEQSIMHRKHVEYCMNGKLMAVRRDGDGF